MDPNLPPLLSRATVDSLCHALRKKLENNGKLTRVTRRDVEMYERNFDIRVPRDMAGRVDYLDDNQATLGRRLEMMRSIQHTIQHNKEFMKIISYEPYKGILTSAKTWAVMLAMEWSELDALGQILRADNGAIKVNKLKDFLQACNNVGGLMWWMTDTPRSKKEEIWIRNETQRRATLERDGFRCVLTNSAVREVCHICPFWSLPRRHKIQSEVVMNLGHILGNELHDRLLASLNQRTPTGERTAPGNFDLLDSTANMVTLSNQLHKLWDDGVFGLEPFHRRVDYVTADESVSQDKPGTGPSAVKRGAKAAESQPPHKRVVTKGGQTSEQTKNVIKEKPKYTIQLRFHWLPKTNLGGFGDSPPTLDADPRTMWKDWDHDNVRDNGHATPLENGHIITFTSMDKYEIPSWDLLTIQWLAFKLHRLSGAADINLYAPQKDQDDDEALAARVVQAKREATVTVAERLGVDPDELWANPQGPYYVGPDTPRPRDD
ncbi:hypothetical protein LY78DRAFT_584686 [Colletotrichum sublineola]|nr:hypothetical protein LY78DRAFT_584686 [Colletotrichum sublineola]